jgi:hypothetical protein
MNADERRACDGLDDASIMETMAWLKEQCLVLHFELQRASGIMVGNDKGRDETSLPYGGSEQ